MNAAMKSQRLDDVSLMARLYRVVLTDVAFHAGVKASEANRDIKYLTTRLSSEGISFATKVLPQLGKATLSAFQSGRFTRPSSFKARGSGALPSFLYGLTKQLFNNDGLLKDLSTEDGVDKAVWGIEQICFLFYKYELPYAPNLVEEKYQNLKQVNDELPKTLSDFDLDYTDRTVLALAGTIIQDLMADVDLQTIIPNCGPGSTATGNVSRNEKISKIMRSSSVPGYPKGIYGTYLELSETNCTSSRFVPALWDDRVLEWDRCSTLHFVPKDSRGPRGISCEPMQNMWIQQGQRAVIEDAAHSKSRGRINFKDQMVNARLALEASKTGEYATLDMKDASDRVSIILVELLFGACDKILPLLLASRSTHTRYKVGTAADGSPIWETIKLNKFAPMGSAVCFPVESMIFWALAVASQLTNPNYQYSELGDPRKSTYVFGDDIILPSSQAEYVMDRMEHFHLRFNRDKSFVTGPFRESCGCDAFLGEVVTPIKLKTLFPRSLRDVSGFSAWNSYMNAFAASWMWNTSFEIEKILTESLPLRSGFPRTRRRLGCFTAFTFSDGISGEVKPHYVDQRAKDKYDFLMTTDRFDKRRHQYISSLGDPQGSLVKGWVIKPMRNPITNFDEDAGLFDWLTQTVLSTSIDGFLRPKATQNYLELMDSKAAEGCLSPSLEIDTPGAHEVMRSCLTNQLRYGRIIVT